MATSTFYFQTLQGEQLTVPVSGLYSSASIVATQVSRYATAAAVIEHWEPGTDLRSTELRVLDLETGAELFRQVITPGTMLIPSGDGTPRYWLGTASGATLSLQAYDMSPGTAGTMIGDPLSLSLPASFVDMLDLGGLEIGFVRGLDGPGGVQDHLLVSGISPIGQVPTISLFPIGTVVNGAAGVGEPVLELQAELQDFFASGGDLWMRTWTPDAPPDQTPFVSYDLNAGIVRKVGENTFYEARDLAQDAWSVLRVAGAVVDLRTLGIGIPDGAEIWTDMGWAVETLDDESVLVRAEIIPAGDSLGYEHWILLDDQGALIAHKAFASGAGPLMRSIDDGEAGAIYFQQIHATGSFPDLVQAVDEAITVHRVAANKATILALLDPAPAVETLAGQASVETVVAYSQQALSQASPLPAGQLLVLDRYDPVASNGEALAVGVRDDLQTFTDLSGLVALSRPIDGGGVQIDAFLPPGQVAALYYKPALLADTLLASVNTVVGPIAVRYELGTQRISRFDEGLLSRLLGGQTEASVYLAFSDGLGQSVTITPAMLDDTLTGIAPILAVTGEPLVVAASTDFAVARFEYLATDGTTGAILARLQPGVDGWTIADALPIDGQVLELYPVFSATGVLDTVRVVLMEIGNTALQISWIDVSDGVVMTPQPIGNVPLQTALDTLELSPYASITAQLGPESDPLPVQGQDSLQSFNIAVVLRIEDPQVAAGQAAVEHRALMFALTESADGQIQSATPIGDTLGLRSLPPYQQSGIVAYEAAQPFDATPNEVVFIGVDGSTVSTTVTGAALTAGLAAIDASVSLAVLSPRLLEYNPVTKDFVFALREFTDTSFVQQTGRTFLARLSWDGTNTALTHVDTALLPTGLNGYFDGVRLVPSEHDGALYLALGYTMPGSFAPDRAFRVDYATGTPQVVELVDPQQFLEVETAYLNPDLSDNEAPVFVSGTTAEADGSAPAGTQVYDADVTDASAVRFSLSGADKDAFVIDPDSGVVTISTRPDFGVQSSYSFTVEAADAAGNKSSLAVTLSVTGGTDPDQAITGTELGEALVGGSGNDSILGLGGDDTLTGGDGADTLDGGAGNDDLYGGLGADVYRFGPGSGTDVVHNSDPDGAVYGAVDTIELGAGVGAADVALSREFDDLIIRLAGGTDSLRVSGYFFDDATTSAAVDQLRFADSTVWDVAAIKARVLMGTDEADVMLGYASADTLDGRAGDDALYGGDGADLLTGGVGDDYLDGGDGADTLDGGVGNDELHGGLDADVYRFGLDSGQDLVSNDYADEAVDTIEFGAGITAADVALSRIDDDLIIGLAGGTDSLRVSGYFWDDATSGAAIDQLRFADATVWDVATIKAKVQAGTDGADVLVGYDSADDTLDGGLGDDTLDGRLGNDLLTGGAGNDSLYGGDGADTLDGGAGNDLLYGGYGADVYRFGLGSGQDVLFNDYADDAVDTIEFGAGIAAADVVLRRVADDLLITVKGATDSLQVQSYFLDNATSGHAIDILRFTNGTQWNVAYVQQNLSTEPVDSGVVIDGYVSSATVARENGSGNIVITDASGRFAGLTGTGPMIAIGGIDIVTGQAVGFNMRAPEGAAVISPLTTLVQALVDGGATPAAAYDSVAAKLGLTATQLRSDPWANLGVEDLAVIKSAVQVANLLRAAVTEGADGTLAAAALINALKSVNDLSEPMMVAAFFADPALGIGNAGTLAETLAQANAGVAAATTVDKLEDAQSRPSVTISLSDIALNVGETATVTLTFSEAPQGFDLADIQAENGTLSNLQLKADSGGLVYTATYTPLAGVTDTTNLITVGTEWTDSVGNAPAAITTSGNYAVDTAAPAVLSDLTGQVLTRKGQALPDFEAQLTLSTLNQLDLALVQETVAVDGSRTLRFALTLDTATQAFGAFDLALRTEAGVDIAGLTLGSAFAGWQSLSGQPTGQQLNVGVFTTNLDPASHLSGKLALGELVVQVASGHSGPVRVAVDELIVGAAQAQSGVLRYESVPDQPGGNFAFLGLEDGQLDLSFMGNTSIIGRSITAQDALEALRLAVRMPSAYSDAHGLIAADYNQDGRVTSQDALEILKTSVRMPGAIQPQWVFISDEADLSALNSRNTAYKTGLTLEGLPDDASHNFTAVLLGDVNDSLSFQSLV